MATPTTLPASFTSGQVLTAAQMNNLRGAFRILQVVSTTKTDTFTATASSFTDITGLSATITPSSTSSQILVLSTLNIGVGSTSTIWMTNLVRGSTNIFLGDAAGSRRRGYAGSDVNNANAMWQPSIVFLDSPATTSPITYKIQGIANGGGSVIYINRTSTDTDNSTWPRMASNITLLEVSA